MRDILLRGASHSVVSHRGKESSRFEGKPRINRDSPVDAYDRIHAELVLLEAALSINPQLLQALLLIGS